MLLGILCCSICSVSLLSYFVLLSECREWSAATPGVLMQISVLDETVHDAQRVVTAQLQQESSIIIYFSITTFANHTLHKPGIISNL